MCAALVALPGLARAQDQQKPEPTLEDLIPDSAVENPQDWAQQGTDQPAAPSADVATTADAPIENAPDITVEWPESLQIPAIAPLTPEPDIDFASVELGAPQIAFSDADTQKLSDNLVLGFPQTEPPFTQRGALVSRFESLSTIEGLETKGDENVAQLVARAGEDEDLLNNLLRVYGYYDGQIIRTIGPRPVGKDNVEGSPVVRFDIVQGPRYRVGAVNLGQLGTAPDATTLRSTFKIEPGDYLDSDTIVTQRFNLDRALGDSGYPFAVIDDPQLLIDHDRREGDLTMPVRPGGKYVFGTLTGNDPKFLSSRHLQRIARFKPGETYSRSLEMDLRRAITATGLVSSVAITPREETPPKDGEPGVVALDVALERAKLRTVAGAIGYGSEEGVRVQASWENRNMFPPEGMVRFRGVVGTQEQLLGATFRRNNLGGRDRVLNVDAYVSTIDSPAFDANTVALVASFERISNLLFQKPVGWSIGAELVATDERPPIINGLAQPRQTYFVAALPSYVQIDTTDDLLDPMHGYRLRVWGSPEISRSQGTQSIYLRSRIDASYYQRAGSKVVIAGRVALGSIFGTGIDNVAPSRRFYAGGGGSVRGYGYRKIGPQDTVGEPTGGRSLAEAAIEARIQTGWFGGALSIVPFLDAGSVGVKERPDFHDVRFGTGLGVRYKTGFGPIRVDVGVPINKRPSDAAVAVYVSLGQAF